MEWIEVDMARLLSTRPHNAPRGHIVVIDDDVELLRSTRRLLEREGHTVTIESDPELGIAQVRRTRPDLLLVDFHMPSCTGAEVVARIREFDPMVQVVLVTGYASEHPARQMLRELDIQGYHDKGEGPDRLLVQVDTAIKHRVALRRMEDALADARQKQRRLERARRHLREVLESLGEPILVADGDGAVRFANTAATRLMQCPREEILGTPLLAHFEGGPTLEQARRDGQIARQATLLGPMEVPVLLTLATHEAEDGSPTFLCSATDLSSLKRTESELRLAARLADEANQTKSRFLAAMSHELRTPLNVIIGYAEMLLEEAGDRDFTSIDNDLGRIREAGSHLLCLVSDVLDLSKVESGRMELAPSVVDVKDLVEDLVHSVRPMVARNRNRLVVDVEEVGETWSDSTRLRQILLNLLSNAAKFTSDGAITLSVRREENPCGDRLVFDVSDTGIGIPESAKAWIFEPFRQADANTQRKYGGTGLGLVLCRRFAEMMNGSIGLESTEGVGTRVTVVLPVAAVGRAVGAA